MFLDTEDLIQKIEKTVRFRMKEGGVVSLGEFRRTPRVTPFTLLVIEDDVSVRQLFQRIFEKEDYRVLMAADALELSRWLGEVDIDLIVLDIGLPWIDGFELARLMKEHEVLRSLPLIFISGDVRSETMKNAFSVGADDYIKKPFEVTEIQRAVSTLKQLHYD